MSLRTRSTVTVLAVALLACGEPFQPLAHEVPTGASVRVTVAPGEYRSGASVPLIVRNLGDQHYIWNPCMRGLEVNAGLGWVAVAEPDRWCNALGWILHPGDRTQTTTDLDAPLPPGEYRLRFGFSRRAGDFNVTDQQVSNPFTVTP